jgi:nucleoid-associated protein YgaU
MKFNLKKFLKNLKLNEESISMILGALVIVIVGILIVNYFKDKKSQTTPEALSTTATTQTSSGKTHTVIKGETLLYISEDTYGSGFNWTDIYKSNNLKTKIIEVGQVLTLPDVLAKQPTATKPVSTINQGTKTVTTSSYTVVHGDNLWKIAVAAYGDGYKWVEIAKANHLSNPGVIYAGNVLTLPR